MLRVFGGVVRGWQFERTREFVELKGSGKGRMEWMKARQ